MKSKWRLFAAVFQLTVGILAIASFVILAIGGEPVREWIVTLVLAVAFVVLGIIGLVDCKSKG